MLFFGIGAATGAIITAIAFIAKTPKEYDSDYIREYKN